MNLAQVIDYDIKKRTYHINHHKAHLPIRRRSVAPTVGIREHHAPRGDRPTCDGGVRRALRNAGREVLAVMKSGGKRLTFGQIAKAIPHVKEGTLSVRLLSMVARGDVMREGERRHYYYTATMECS